MASRVAAVVRGNRPAPELRGAIEVASAADFVGSEALTARVAPRTDGRESSPSRLMTRGGPARRQRPGMRSGPGRGLGLGRRAAVADRVVVRPPRPLAADQSPVAMIRDLLGLRSIAVTGRSAGPRWVVAARSNPNAPKATPAARLS